MITAENFDQIVPHQDLSFPLNHHLCLQQFSRSLLSPHAILPRLAAKVQEHHEISLETRPIKYFIAGIPD
jgi:hypothetical protein